MSGYTYTGISEIDLVLLDLYNEQVKLEEALRIKPHSKPIIERHRRVVRLVDRLLEFGRLVQATSEVVPGHS